MQRALGPREIDQHVTRRERRLDVVRDAHATRRAGKFANVAAEQRTAGDFERGGKLRGRIGAHGMDEHAPHAAGTARDRDFHAELLGPVNN